MSKGKQQQQENDPMQDALDEIRLQRHPGKADCNGNVSSKRAKREPTQVDQCNMATSLHSPIHPLASPMVNLHVFSVQTNCGAHNFFFE